MKKTLILQFIIASIAFCACSTDVDLYADYKDITIIYGLVDVKADTNFIKITKAFCGNNDNYINANEVALIYDSSNYQEKLKAYIVELQSVGGQSYTSIGHVFELDTLTIHNKQEGQFYSPDQTLYFTSEQFMANDDVNKYKYKLVVVKPDGDTVSSITSTVGGGLDIVSSKVFFQLNETDVAEQVFFHSSEEGVLYDFKMQFDYREKHAGQEMVRKRISWTFGAKPLSAYEKKGDNLYVLNYPPNTMFNLLSNAIGGDTVWDANHPNVVRYIDDFVITMTVGGRELYESYLMTQNTNYTHVATAFSNIEGGYGLFSSRVVINKTVQLSSITKRDLFRVQSWGFIEE